MIVSPNCKAFILSAVFCVVAGGVTLNGAEKKPRPNEKLARLQIFLDRENFGPGKIDGIGGEFTTKALTMYRESHQDAPSSDDDLAAQFEGPTLVDYTIVADDQTKVGVNAKTKAKESQQKAMLYPSILAMVAEKFHSDSDYLRSLNPGRDLESLKISDSLKVPNVIPFKLEKLENDAVLKPRPDFKDRSIDVGTANKMLKLLAGSRLIAVFPITPGSTALPAPSGTWKIEQIVTLPPYRWDPEMLNHGKRSAKGLNLPPGPRSPVGVLWVQLNKPGIGIHGTDDPESIGRSASHGCIRLSNWDAAKLSEMITKGMRAVIQ